MSVSFERRNVQTVLNQLEVKGILSRYYSSPINVERFELANTGLANTNYIISFDGNTVVLRVYNQSTKAAQKELEVLKLLSSQQFIPELYFSDVKEGDDIQYALIEFMVGDLLEVFLSQKDNKLENVFFQLGEFSGRLTKIKFPSPGLFGVDLSVKEINTSNKNYNQHVCFILDCLDNPLVETRVGKKLSESLADLAKDSSALLDDVADNFHLVHGDFKSSNILVQQNDKLSLSGVIDWEYARSDTVYADMATLFRGNYLRDSKEKRAFVDGFNALSSYALSDNWENIAKIVDLINLLDFLSSKKARDKLYQNVLWNLQETVKFVK